MLNLIGAVIAFVVIIILIRKQFDFGLSLILGSIILGVFSLQSITVYDIPKAILEATIYHFDDQPLQSIVYSFDVHRVYTGTVELAVLMTLIYVLAKCMQDTGAIKKLIDSLRTIFSKGGTIGIIPAVYGLMPVPGGALFSAPVIDEEGDKYSLDKNQKNFFNVWFRHIWFTVYPVSSAMIIICSKEFSNIQVYVLVFANIPAFIASVFIGFILLKKFVKVVPGQVDSKRDYSGLIYLLPTIVPLFFYGFLWFFKFSQIRSFVIGVVFSIILVGFITGTSFKKYLYIVKKSLTLKFVLVIFGIMIFREMFQVSGANVAIADIINTLPFPALLVIIIIPFILGILTGYNLGAIALSYFLVEPFFGYTGLNIVGLTSIVFISSLMGYLISPIHLCNVLSSDYLKTDTTRMYKIFIPAAVSLLILQTIFVMIWFK